MRVGYNARLLAFGGARGWNRYTVNLLAELPACGVEPVLYSDRPLDGSHLARLPAGSYEVRIGNVRPYALWEQGWLPWRSSRDRLDLFHAPANFGLPAAARCRKVLTLHDAIDEVYQRVPGLASLRARLSHALARRAADLVITVSPHARLDLVRRLGLPGSKIEVVAEGADPRFHETVGAAARAEVRNRYGLTRPYVFYVGGWERRKNVGFLLRAFAASGLAARGVDLVLAGADPSCHPDVTGLAGSLGLGKAFRAPGRVDDGDLPALYSEALAFVYPSEYEGFGLQLCEAFACGCPAFAADATSLPWVLGGGGETFPLGDVGPLAGMLRRVFEDGDWRADLARRSAARSGAFSWRGAAEATAGLYRGLLA